MFLFWWCIAVFVCIPVLTALYFRMLVEQNQTPFELKTGKLTKCCAQDHFLWMLTGRRSVFDGVSQVIDMPVDVCCLFCGWARNSEDCERCKYSSEAPHCDRHRPAVEASHYGDNPPGIEVTTFEQERPQYIHNGAKAECQLCVEVASQ